MRRTAILNVVGLTNRLIGEWTPNLRRIRDAGSRARIAPAFPAVTCTAQANYLTGRRPRDHGIVGNGWYHRELAEIQFWKQSNHLVTAPKLWEELRRRDPEFTCAKLFWWFNMHSTADYSITPRPMYPADGRKVFDIYTQPGAVRFDIQRELGPFPFATFWGPAAGVNSPRGGADAASRWIAESAKWIETKYRPTLSLVYLPHLDYNLQRRGVHGQTPDAGNQKAGNRSRGGRGGVDSKRASAPSGGPPLNLDRAAHAGERRSFMTSGDEPEARVTLISDESPELTPQSAIVPDLRAIDAIVGDLVAFFAQREVQVVILSEYGISDVDRPIHLNRLFRRQDPRWVAIREELGLELLDPGASQVFAVADHQVAHLYLNNRSLETEVREIVAQTGATVLGAAEKAAAGIDHPRAGDLIAVAPQNAWFTYYYWLDDARAPDFARCVDIHRKPGYDPVELFTDPALSSLALKAKIGWRLLQKRLGFRMVMDVIPLDASLVKGSHGARPESDAEWPVMLTERPGDLPADALESIAVSACLRRLITAEA